MYSSFFKSFLVIFIFTTIYSVFITISPYSSITFSDSEFIWPLPGNKNITSNFGPRISPTSGISSFHYGLDIGATEGTEIHSIASGIVTFTGFQRWKWIYNIYSK